MLGQLKGILRERQYEESLDLMERRRRAGFVPPRSKVHTADDATILARLEEHPPGWILNGGGKKDPSTQKQSLSSMVVESLERKCIQVLSRCIMEYLEAMGREDLHAALSLLPPDTLAELSIAVSKGNGISNDLAYCIGKHAHVEELSLRSNMKIGCETNNYLTDEGLLELVPRLPSKAQCDDGSETIVDDWEDACNDWSDETMLDTRPAAAAAVPVVVDVLHLDGVNVGLKRLELIDCLYLSSKAIMALLQKCACITHLSLAGSIQVIDDGMEVIRALPELLPDLQVLDVTRCSWVTGDLLAQMRDAYERGPTSGPSSTSHKRPPIVHCQGFLPSEDFSRIEEPIRNNSTRPAAW
jgi:hypothetical protein